MSPFSDLPTADETQLLINRAKSGDDDALNDLFRRHHDHLLLAVRLRLGNRMRGMLESVDVFQSVALEAFRDLDQFEARGKGSFRHYLNKLVFNKICDRARYFDAAKRSTGRETSPSQLEQLPAADSEPGYIDTSGRFERLEQEIKSLSEETRQVVVLRAVDDLPSQEVATVLGKTDAAVRKTYSRALARLARRLGDPGAR